MIETEPDSTQSPDDSLNKESLLLTVRGLLRTCQTREDLFRSVFEHCVATFRPVAGRCDYQINKVAHQVVYSDPNIGEDVQTHFNDQFLQPVNVELQKAKPPQPMLKRFPQSTKSLTEPIALVAVPMVNLRNGQIDCAISLVVSDVNGQADHIVAQLDAIVALVSVVTGSSNDTSTLERETDAIHKVAQCDSVQEFAFGIVNSLCNRLQCEQVGFGVERNRRIELLSVSGLPRFKSNSPGIAQHRQAMEECLDADRVVSHQGNASNETFPIHRQWSANTGMSCVLSIPLKSGDQTIGVISLRRPSARPFSNEEVDGVTRTIQSYGSAVRLLDRVHAPMTKQIQRSIGKTVRDNTTVLRLIGWTAIGLGLWWFAFGTMAYRPICQTTVVAAELRHFTAPYPGKLDRVHIAAGDSVVQGQLLAQFDVREQQLQLEAINAELDETNINQREAQQAGDQSQVALHQARGNVLTAKANALLDRIERGRLVAPANGTVIQADLNRRIGQVFRQGEEVLLFAPDGGWMLEIAVPDHVASHVARGQVGEFSAAARPSQTLKFEVKQLDGSASVLDGKNVFIARAPLQDNPDWMLNGMQGFGRLQTTRQPVWWVCCHTAIDWAHSRFWL